MPTDHKCTWRGILPPWLVGIFNSFTARQVDFGLFGEILRYQIDYSIGICAMIPMETLNCSDDQIVFGNSR